MKDLPKIYMIKLSTKDEVRVDGKDELDKIVQAINKLDRGGIIVTKDGMFNPSYLVCIYEDTRTWEKENHNFHLTGNRDGSGDILPERLENKKLN